MDNEKEKYTVEDVSKMSGDYYISSYCVKEVTKLMNESYNEGYREGYKDKSQTCDSKTN